ncbi:hypothetical protein KM043_009215 [Ampulex compressa]|nr:hypothetical protein KM043_009215 [Ampulex compressa]
MRAKWRKKRMRRLKRKRRKMRARLRKSIPYNKFSAWSAVKDESDQEDDHNLAGGISKKYKAFREEDGDIIFDVNEVQEQINLEYLNKPAECRDPYEGLNLERGVKGVFDIEDIMAVLQKDNAKQIFVAAVPPEYSYVDYIIVVTAKSQKHMQALATFVRKVYKLKRHKNDILPKVEGKQSKDWIAMDLGNIAIHIFSASARAHYDLETLWSVGAEYDDECNKPESNIMDQYNTFMADFEPADPKEARENSIS